MKIKINYSKLADVVNVIHGIVAVFMIACLIFLLICKILFPRQIWYVNAVKKGSLKAVTEDLK